MQPIWAMQPDNGDYSDLIHTKRLFCGRARPTERRNDALDCAESGNLFAE
jgi:hypothetical protein